MKYRILEQSGTYDTHYTVQYKKWGLWRYLGYWNNDRFYHIVKEFKTIEEAEKDVLAFYKFKNRKTKTAVKKEGEVK